MQVKFKVALTILSCAMLLFPKSSQQRQHFVFEYKMKTIVIDAGHGGYDDGCHGINSYEKNVTLSLALKLGGLIEKNIPGIKIIYTRKTDEFIELYERADIANRNNADLFISIHCNANKNTAAFGTESWTMGLHKTEGNLDVAKRENASILLENDYQTKYDGFDPNSPEAYIMLSLNQNAFMNQSITLASKVEDAFITDGRQSRGVKQAGFLVLWRTTMPSTLIETGFLTNRNEEKYMTSESGQNEIATSIFESVDAYRTKMEKEVNGLFSTENRTITKVDTVKKDSVKPISEIKNETIKPLNEKSETEKPVIEKKEIVKDEIIYKIQIAASEKSINLKSTTYAQFKDAVNDVSVKSINRIVIGNYKSIEDAKARLTLVKKQGFKDAFIVGYNNGVRFTIH